jgi:hypothetical protein
MMDYLKLSGVVIGSLFIGIYVYYARRKKASVSLARATVLFLSGNAFIAGVKVMIFAFNTDLLALAQKQGIEPAHLFLGGLAICWVSILSVLETFRQVPQTVTQTQSQIG